MTPWIHLDTATIPNGGGELKLSRRGDEFSIRLSGVRGELMNSRVHGSEESLSELGCAHLGGQQNPRVLVGGLGMGFTLAAALKAVPPSAEVIVAELIPEVEQWNRGPLGECAGRPLDDPRARVAIGDVANHFKARREQFDAILLDVDNGPEGLTHSDNSGLYSQQGLAEIFDSLHPEGMLAVWSAGADSLFTIRLKKAGFKVSIRTVRARPGKGSRHTIFLAQKPWRSASR
ncbi:spermidine synthase [Aestuariirhabdus litorea]|uniref:MnmC-like methyltransferase domain-containing protein n=1 Tax=Aestuariirhabdus litorea TaxID=2528527 RepID=A0A3P3VKX6_9GAMM|nr:MnmC family methyltransferase [Aestuariirhabdus litorea]RRJ83392.1 hypothetical protein D0544_16385 [Aestuariirhabdus litorea]RWW93553.1 hypothetical protein DZC74_16355 [Endozoicomonadaceae bacterium GTF-13]